MTTLIFHNSQKESRHILTQMQNASFNRTLPLLKKSPSLFRNLKKSMLAGGGLKFNCYRTVYMGSVVIDFSTWIPGCYERSSTTANPA